MKFLATGFNYQTMPGALQEALNLSQSNLPNAVSALENSVGRGVVLATCNRLEVYTFVDSRLDAQEVADTFWRRHFDTPQLSNLRPYMYVMEQGPAIRHLFRVTASLDSLILGESEILGQVREAYSYFSKRGLAGGSIAKVFHEALRVGKRVRTETQIGRNPLSVSRACVQILKQSIGNIASCKAVILGAGNAGRLAALALKDSGVTDLVLTNRTLGHAEILAGELGAHSVSIEQLPRLISETDILISATGSPDWLIDRSIVSGSRLDVRSSPLMLVDLGIPRDIDPSVSELDNVLLYTIDDLHLIADSNRLERQLEGEKAEIIVEEEVIKFTRWINSQSVRPTIKMIRNKVETYRQGELLKLFSRVPRLSETEKEQIESMSKALVKKVLHDPTTILANGHDPSLSQMARVLFGLEGRKDVEANPHGQRNGLARKASDEVLADERNVGK